MTSRERSKHRELDERTWWNQFGHLNEAVWQYEPALSRIVRSEYLTELDAFLYKAGGRVLDVGCGQGWVGLRLARRGMQLDGIDLSDAQIEEARRRAAEAGVENVHFWRADARALEGHGQYDSIIVHSVIHHLDPDGQVDLLTNLADLLSEGGRAYLYEPLAATPDPPLTVAAVDKALGGLIQGLTWAARVSGIMARRFREAHSKGWNMCSPEEDPIQLDRLLAACPDALEVVKVTVWHAYSVAYANLCMMLSPAWRRRAGRLAPLFYRLDRFMLSRSWHRYLRAWPMAGIALAKRHQS